MKLKDYLKKKGHTSYTIAKIIANGKEGKGFENTRQRVLNSLRRDERNDLTLKYYRLFADALEMPLKDLLSGLGHL